MLGRSSLKVPSREVVAMVKNGMQRVSARVSKATCGEGSQQRWATPQGCRVSSAAQIRIDLSRHWPSSHHYAQRRMMSDMRPVASGSKEEEVLAKLSNVIDPDFQQDIVTLQFVKNMKIAGSSVSFDLELTTPACPVKEQFKADCEKYIRELHWVQAVEVNITAQHKTAGPLGGKNRSIGCPGLKKVKRVIAVSSAKGGVGKSTISVNLAYSIAKLGGKVGIFDADIFGPSLPTMVTLADPRVTLSKENDAMLAPLEYEGVKLMSYGFTAKGKTNQASVMRGPMVSSTVHQLIAFTDWGDLDYLIIDFPPGTGDIQLTLCQEVTIDGAVVVTTPQRLSFVDVVRGIEMFDNLNVPVVGLVENMAYFDCGNCGTRAYPFGPGHKEQISKEYGTPAGFQIPMHPDITKFSDTGHPVVLDGGNAMAAELWTEIASAVVQEISKVSENAESPPLVEFDQDSGKIWVRTVDGPATSWTPLDLRSKCTSAKYDDKANPPPPPPEDLSPAEISPKGRYAVQVNWSDGHVSIFPYKTLKEGAQSDVQGA